MTWKMYAHKKRPEVRYWARPMYIGWVRGENPARSPADYEIRAPRMCGETEDRSPERSQAMGVMPAEFAEIYEEVE